MKVLELYSGIGGMHFALKESGIAGEIIAAIDINTTANKVYGHNFPSTKLLQRNIQSFSAKEINDFNIDMILMSPPCQPFTRVGLKKDLTDNRTSSFLYLLSIFPQIKAKWKYLLVENVKGFENSLACQHLIHTLDEMDFCYQQFILSPSMFSIPNTRHRYYLIAKRRPLSFSFPTESRTMESLPFPLHNNYSNSEAVFQKMTTINSKHKNLVVETQTINSEAACYSINQVLDKDKAPDYFDQFNVSDKVLGKYAWLLDIIGPESTRSCCFTKAYGHYVEGTGSVFCPSSPNTISSTFEQSNSHTPGSSDQLNLLKGLRLRYFTPNEVGRLMCFPDHEFSLPPNITVKQSYRLLGNSINVHVVALLILLMIGGDNLLS